MGERLTRLRWRVARVLLRVALSAVASGVIVGVGSLALFVTSWPKWLSMTIEPVSLVLTPGVVASLVFSGKHDYTEGAILSADLLFYFFACAVALWAWERRARRRRTEGND